MIIRMMKTAICVTLGLGLLLLFYQNCSHPYQAKKYDHSNDPLNLESGGTTVGNPKPTISVEGYQINNPLSVELCLGTLVLHSAIVKNQYIKLNPWSLFIATAHAKTDPESGDNVITFEDILSPIPSNGKIIGDYDTRVGQYTHASLHLSTKCTNSSTVRVINSNGTFSVNQAEVINLNGPVTVNSNTQNVIINIEQLMVAFSQATSDAMLLQAVQSISGTIIGQ